MSLQLLSNLNSRKKMRRRIAAATAGANGARMNEHEVFIHSAPKKSKDSSIPGTAF